MFDHSHRLTLPRATPRIIAGSVLAAALACMSAGCAPIPPPPYPLAFTITVSSPRLLETSRETTVKLLVSNAGQRAWDPARIHVSYHWLWLIPRELIHRSRLVPYQDGIRTDLDRTVAPGASVALEGRLLPPAWPGVYWLQWDMVEEGVGWFAQLSPRQPRTLVVVLPPIGWMLAPLPLLVATWGLFSRRARYADALWCAAALAVKPLILAHEALLEPSAVAYWLIGVFALMVPLVGVVVLPRRLRPIILVVVGSFCSVLILADILYYRFFGDLLSAPVLLAAQQTGRVRQSIASLFSPGLIWLLADCVCALCLAIRMTLAPRPVASFGRRVLALATASVLLATIGIALSPRRVLASASLDQMFRDRSVAEQLGPFGFHLYDVWNYGQSRWLKAPLTAAQFDRVASWLAARAPLRAGSAPRFGAAQGRNLIVVQVESLQDFAVDFRIADQDVMPHLKAWTRDSLRFTNLTDQTNQGRTSDAEFTTLTSLLPLDHGAVAFRYPANRYVGLPAVLAEHGYSTSSAVAFESGFWNRGVMHPSYGFQKTFFEPDFQLTEQIGWGLNDRDFLQQMVPRLEQSRRPFAAWLITLSLHHPFEDFPDRHKVLKLGSLEGSSFGNYLHTMRFFDTALEEFKASLARDGLLDDSVIVVFGDHDAGFTRDADLSRQLGIGAGEVGWSLNDRVPLFVRVPGGALAGVEPRPAGQTDLAPTLLALLGIDPAPLPYVGRNLLGAADDLPVPRPYGDWLDASHLFLSRGPESVCIAVAGRSPIPIQACADADRAATQEREFSRLVITEDLQQRLRSRLRELAR
ncbi:MAG TPA: LTA synthase family protein [Vicinamibacterales bacterium]